MDPDRPRQAFPLPALPDSESGIPPRTFALRGRGGVVTLDDRGLHHPRAPRGQVFVLTPYEDVTHLTQSERAVWLGTRRSVYVLPRWIFEDAEAPEILVRCLLARIASRPGGRTQLARMAGLEERAHAEAPCRATWGLTFACLAVFVVQLVGGFGVEDVGYFGGALVADGDWWRVVTANFLHAVPEVPIHLAMNLLGLIALGTLTERPLGTPGTAVVMGASGLGAMGGSALAGYAHVVGVSGVVFGLLGAVTWLEFRRADRLPAWWRVPRRALLWMLGLSALLPLVLPMIAGAAHLGGLLAGAAVTAWLVGDRPLRPPGRRLVRFAAGLVVLVSLLALGQAASFLLRPHAYAAYRVAQLARLPDVSPQDLNNRAWMIAIDPDSPRPLLESALALAQRAAAETEREDANILDTVAELQFQLGREEAALATIEEAILREPEDAYFREQRRRFLGERPREDRPAGPALPGAPDAEEAPGLTVRARPPVAVEAGLRA